MTRLETTASHSSPFTAIAGRVLWAGVVALATACGGGGESTPVPNVNQPVVTTPPPTSPPPTSPPPTSPPPTSPPPETAYSVVVKTVDTQGQPIVGVAVALFAGGLDWRADTGGDGTTTFTVGARQTGEAVVFAFLTGYHTADRQFRLEANSSPSEQQLTLMRTDEAQLVLGGVKSEISADAASVVVSAGIAVIGLNGSPIAGLSAVDFTVPELDCFFSVCILDPSGTPLSTGYWVPSQEDPLQVTLQGAGTSTLYRMRYVLEATPGMFTAGSTVLTWVRVRVGDTSLVIQADVRL